MEAEHFSECYASRCVFRKTAELFTRTQQTHIAQDVEERVLARYWKTHGAARPMVVRLARDPEHLWVVESKTKGAKYRFHQPSNVNPRLWAYQINQQTGRWTETRSNTIYAGSIQQVLDPSERIVRKAWKYAFTQRMTQAVEA